VSGSPLDALLLTLLEMVVGGLGALLLTAWRGPVTPGFVRLCALLVGPLAVLAWLVPGQRAWPLSPLVALCTIGAVAYCVVVLLGGGPGPRHLAGLLGLLAGALALGVLAVRIPGPLAPALPLLAALADALVLGAAGVGLVLGHWYLVTPRLSAVPLRRLVDLLLLGLALEALAIGLPVLVGGVGLADVLFWGRLSALVLLPTVVGLAARACCREWPRGRALQAATGLLYVATGSVFGAVLLGNLLRVAPPGAA
jgi:hypothetical protein